MTSGFFVTGTDTGVGKTLIACALLHALANSGKRTLAMKPVAAGCTRNGEQLTCDDVTKLCASSNLQAPYELVCPYAFEPAIAPHIAAEQAGTVVDLQRIHTAFKDLCSRADAIVVEGVGGFRVPLNATQDTMHLAQLLALPVVLVVGLRLGCLNHALLTAQAIEAAGLTLAGWVTNQVDPAMSYPTENINALAARLPAPLLATVGYSNLPDATTIAAQFRLENLASTR